MKMGAIGEEVSGDGGSEIKGGIVVGSGVIMSKNVLEW